MFELSAAWSEFYRELDPIKRAALLESLCASEPDDGANACRRQLFKARHADARRPLGEVDHFLYHAIAFMQQSQSVPLLRRRVRRQVERALREMGIGEAASLGEAGAAALDAELRNMAMRYFESCDNAGYNRQLFGLMASSEAARRDRLCRDVWHMTRGIARLSGMDAALAPWCRAIEGAYFSLDREAQARFDAFNQKME